MCCVFEIRFFETVDIVAIRGERGRYNDDLSEDGDFHRRTNADPSKVRSNSPPAQVFPNVPVATRLDRKFARHADCGVMATPENKKASR